MAQIAYFYSVDMTQDYLGKLVILDGDLLKIRPAQKSIKPRIDDGAMISSAFHGMFRNDGIPLSAEFMPTKIKIPSVVKTLPCFVALMDKTFAVCDIFRELVEEREPGVHQFFPLDIYDEHGVKREERWLLNVCNRAGFFDLETSNLEWEGGTYSHSNIPKKEKRLFFNWEAVKGLSLWIDKYTRGGVYVW